MEYAEIRYEQLQREGALILENQSFDTTLSNLRDSLKFQQHSYYKLNTILNTLLRITIGNLDGVLTETDKTKLYQFSGMLMEDIIKSQTTSSIEVGSFEEAVREELAVHKNVKVRKLESCLIGDIPRVMIANVKALILCAVSYAAREQAKCEVEVISSYLTNTRIYLEINLFYQEDVPVITLQDQMEINYDRVLQEMFTAMTAVQEVVRKDYQISFQLQVPISFLD